MVSRGVRRITSLSEKQNATPPKKSKKKTTETAKTFATVAAINQALRVLDYMRLKRLTFLTGQIHR